jgi:hypothetical protein
LIFYEKAGESRRKPRDELVSLPKSMLTNFISKPTDEKMRLLDKALKAGLQLYDD